MRPTLRTFAGLHAVRLKKVLGEVDTNPTAPAAIFPPAAPLSTTPLRLEEAPAQTFATPHIELYESLFA